MTHLVPHVHVVGFAGDASQIAALNMPVRHDDVLAVRCCIAALAALAASLTLPRPRARARTQAAEGRLRVRCLHVPCHTRDHVLYHVSADDEPAASLFTGDTLFVGTRAGAAVAASHVASPRVVPAGCGRFFEGSAAEMHHALNTVVASLDDGTRVYCGHEYTVANLQFALHVEPGNDDVRRKLASCVEQRARGAPTVPSTVGGERTFNPFMRVGEPALVRAVLAAQGRPADAAAPSPVEMMALLREMKNAFKAPPIPGSL